MPGLLANIVVAVEQLAGRMSGHWTDISQAVLLQFGPAGQWALWGLVAFFVLFVASKATGFAFDVTRFVLLPAAALTVALIVLIPAWDPTKTFTAMMAVTGATALMRSR